MGNQANFQWRVTKYNPDFRDENGCYTLTEEWTCPSEIGNNINGKVFTLDEYIQVETAYINSVIKFIEDSGIKSLRVLNLECTISEEDKESPLYEKEFEKLVLTEDWLVNEKEIRLICKMVLRNFLWCKLYNKGTFFIHFGWDYYMYIGSNVNCLPAIEYARNNGLFVEQCTSPYLFSEEETTREIQWSEIDDYVVLDTEVVNSIPLNECRDIFKLSAEHPVIGSFEVKREHLGFFQKFLKQHKMDFDKYEYRFWGGY